jgi:hypothetical protein
MMRVYKHGFQKGRKGLQFAGDNTAVAHFIFFSITLQQKKWLKEFQKLQIPTPLSLGYFLKKGK